MSDLSYPEHKHPHGVENTQEDPERIWVCTECDCVFADDTIRKDVETGEWGHKCKSNPRKTNDRCESHLEPYVPDVKEKK